MGVDVDSVLERAERFADPMPDGGSDAEARALEEIVRTVYDRAEQTDIGMNAYIGSAPGERENA